MNEFEMYGLAFLVLIFVLIFIFFMILKKAKKNSNPFEILTGILYFFSLIIIGFGFSTHTQDYYTAIDPIDECYTPFASKHLPTLIIYLLLFNISTFIIWRKGIKLPPLTLVLCLVFLVVGVIINFGIVLQASYHDLESILGVNYGREYHMLQFLVAPILSSIIGICLIIKVVRRKSEFAMQVNYSKEGLNKINRVLFKIINQPFFVLFLLLPILLTWTSQNQKGKFVI